MPVRDNGALKGRMSELKRELATLQKQIAKREDKHPPATPEARADAPDPARRTRLGRVNIAPGIMLTTLAGSLYSTICKVLASLGHLSEHDRLFAEFMRRRSVDAAKKLIAAIAVSRTDLEQYVRADDEYRDHCEERTLEYKNKAATGSLKHQRILQNPKICHCGGTWAGDIDEAISILSGARKVEQVRRGKNVQILNQAGLMFDTALVGDVHVCVLYKRKWHDAYTRAMALLM